LTKFEFFGQLLFKFDYRIWSHLNLKLSSNSNSNFEFEFFCRIPNYFHLNSKFAQAQLYVVFLSTISYVRHWNHFSFYLKPKFVFKNPFYEDCSNPNSFKITLPCIQNFVLYFYCFRTIQMMRALSDLNVHLKFVQTGVNFTIILLQAAFCMIKTMVFLVYAVSS
jgi:hypothetical protein